MKDFSKPGWKTAKIGDVCDLMTGGTPSRTKPEYFDGEVRWLVSGDIHRGEITDCEGRISQVGLINSNARLLPVNSVVIALNGQGKTRGTVAMLRTEATCNQSLVSIMPYDTTRLLPEFIFMNLRGRYDEIRKMTGDAGNERRGLNMRLIRGIEIPLPPLEEQQRIVAVLDEVFEGLARAHAEANLQNARELFASFLGQYFLADAEGWTSHTIGSLLSEGMLARPLDGNHGEIHPKKADFVESGVPFIMASDLVDGSVDQTNCYFITREQADGLRKGFAHDGDVLLSHKGTIGRAAILNTDLDYVMLTPQVTYYRVADQERLDRDFLYFAFQSAPFQRQIIDAAKDGATRAYIGITRQLDLRLAIPSIDTQRDLVAVFREVRNHAAACFQQCEAKLVDLNELRQSLLQKAFAGELT